MNPAQTPAPQPNAAPPANGAPVAPIAPPLVAGNAPLSNIEQAARSAIERLEQAPPAAPAGQQPPVQPPVPGDQPRNPDGTFAPKPQDASQGLQQPAGATIPGQEGVDTPPEGSEALEGEEDPLIVQLPARRPDGEPLEIAAPDAETAEAMRRMANGYLRAEQVRAEREELSTMRAQLMERMEAIESDPIAVVESLDPETQRTLALYLVTRPEVWQGLQERVTNFDDPRELQLAAAQAEAERLRTKQELASLAVARREARANARDVRMAVEAMIPETIDDAKAGALYTDMLNDVMQYAQRNNVRLVNVEDLPAILAPRCRLHGINPVEAAQRMSDALTSGRTPRRTGSAPVSRHATPAAPVQRPSVTRMQPRSGQQFVQSNAARRALGSAVPPAGAGSPGNGLPQPPAGQSIEERIAWARTQGLPAR
jgi:hypothetical protein